MNIHVVSRLLSRVFNAFFCCFLLGVVSSQAQNVESSSDRSQRQAENPYKWIIMQDDKPRTKSPSKAPATANLLEKDKKSLSTKGVTTQAKSKGLLVSTYPAVSPVSAAAPVSSSRTRPLTPAVLSPAVAASTGVPAPAANLSAAASIVLPQTSPSPMVLATPTPNAVVTLLESSLPQPLQLLVQVAPEIKREVVSRGIRQGRVKVKFKVLPDGSVAEVQVLTSTNRVLNSPVLAAVSQWKYAPIKQTQEHGAEVGFNLDQ